MKLKSLTKAEVDLSFDDTYGDIAALDSLIYEAQTSLQKFREFNPPFILPKKASDIFSSSPYNYDILQTNLPNQMVSITRIQWKT